MSRITISVRSAGYLAGSVLRDIDLDLQGPGLWLFAGRNGMGKTTLLRTIVGLIPQFDGTISIDGLDPYTATLEQVFANGVTLMPQEGGVFDSLTIEENLKLVRSQEAAFDVLDVLPDLAKRRRQIAGTLSGGERKILGLARAIGQTPKVLLVDEPTEGVWHELCHSISEKLADLSKSAAVIVVEQNLAHFTVVADFITVLQGGTVAVHGPAASVAEDSAVTELLTL